MTLWCCGYVWYGWFYCGITYVAFVGFVWVGGCLRAVGFVWMLDWLVEVGVYCFGVLLCFVLFVC